MKITALMVKELRQRTGVGMMDCKKALVEKEGNIDEAITYLREKGMSKAAKKANRIAAEGLVFESISDDRKSGVILEFNSETDFVAKNEDFINWGQQLTSYLNNNEVEDIDALNKTEIEGKTVQEKTSELIARIGENMSIRRWSKYNDAGFVSTYIHMGGSIGVIAQFEGEATEENILKAKDVTMHIAAMSPSYLNSSEVTEEDLIKEREIARVQLLDEGKPEKIIDKILIGKMKKFYEENCLINQKFVKDDKMTVEEYLTKNNKISKFVRYKIGEGIEKKQEDFASEVAAQIKGQ